MDTLMPQLYLYKSLQGLKEVILFIYNIINFFLINFSIFDSIV